MAWEIFDSEYGKQTFPPAADVYLITHGYSAQGLAAVFVPLGSIVGFFLYREHARRRDE